MTKDVFSGDQSGNEGASALEALVGEDKKFADAEALAKGKQSADAHIKTLEEENATLKAATGDQAPATVADLVEALKSSQKTEPKEGDQPMSDEELQEKVRAIVSGDSELATRKENRELGNALVLDKVKGDAEAATAYVAERATALGTTPAMLAELSEQSPRAFAKLMELDSSTSPKSTTSLPDRINTLGQELNPHAVTEVDGHHTKSYYDGLKAKVGVVKWLNDSNMQMRMAKDMTALGEKFNQ